MWPLTLQALVKSLEKKTENTGEKSVERDKLIEEQDNKELPIQEHEAAKKVSELSSVVHEFPVGDNDTNNKLAVENERLKVCIHKSLKYVILNVLYFAYIPTNKIIHFNNNYD